MSSVKIKTKKSAAKRFSVTGSGKVKFGRANRRHLLTGKPTRMKRQARAAGYACAGDAQNILRLLVLK
jgi:large subunit ribosomal protein L35